MCLFTCFDFCIHFPSVGVCLAVDERTSSSSVCVLKERILLFDTLLQFQFLNNADLYFSSC